MTSFSQFEALQNADVGPNSHRRKQTQELVELSLPNALDGIPTALSMGGVFFIFLFTYKAFQMWCDGQ